MSPSALKNKIYDSMIKDELHFYLDAGDVFMSFHYKNEKCMGICFDKKADWRIEIKNFLEKAEKFFDKDYKEVEVKILGEENKIQRISFQLPLKLQVKCKQVKISTSFELLYIPSQSKVRLKNEIHENNGKSKINLLIVDDSKTIRNILTSIFSSDDNIEVVGSLEHPKLVEDFLKKNQVDVITLDIHMPEMDGVELLKLIYPKFKIPCVMISSVSMTEGSKVFDALENGAVDYIQKPEASEIESLRPLFIEKIKVAAATKNKIIKPTLSQFSSIKEKANLNSMIVLGSSTGGTEAIRNILTKLPENIPPMLIVQHIPPVFSEAFAKRMNEICPFEVKEAEDGDEVIPNRVLIAPGGKQMKFIKKAGKNIVEINNDEPVNRFRPSVDYMFNSVAEYAPKHLVGVILTGMGKDGAVGLKKLRDLGAYTIAQDEASSVVFGMPKEAIALGGADFVENIHQIANRIVHCTNEPVKNRINDKNNNLKKISGL